MLDNNCKPSFVLFLKPDQKMFVPGQDRQDLSDIIVRMLVDGNINHEIIYGIDVNSKEVLDILRKRPERYFIYSGPAGVILKKKIFELGKKFIHIHPGRLPDYRGSTTVYYQILSRDKCSVSAIFLSEKLDTGPIIAVKDFDFCKNLDIDYEYDPVIRSELLVNVLKLYAKTGHFAAEPQGYGLGETYYIMHPVLRHIARLKLTTANA